MMMHGQPLSLFALLLSSATAQVTQPERRLRFNDNRDLCTQNEQSPRVCVTLPTTTTRNEVDVFFLLDGTDSFRATIDGLSNAMASTITQLQAALGPDASVAYGVGQFGDFGGLVSEQFVNEPEINAKPFTLVHPIVAFDNTTMLIETIQEALASSTGVSPGTATDPHTAIEALYEVASGLGFDGDNDGDTVGNRANDQDAGQRSVRENPDTSGDVPAFRTLVGSRRSSGTIGGAGFRENALKIVVVGTDVCTVAPFDNILPLFVESAAYETRVFSLEFSCANRDRFGLLGQVAPDATTTSGAHTVDATVQLLNERGIRVVGLYVDNDDGSTTTDLPEPTTLFRTNGSDDERYFMQALGRLTGTVNDDNDAYLVPYNAVPETLSTSLVTALTNVAQIPAAGIALQSDDCDGLQNGLVGVTFPDPTATSVAVGEQVCFRPTFTLGNGGTTTLQPIDDSCTLNFRDTLLNFDYAQLPVVFECSGTEEPSMSPSEVPSVSPSARPSAGPSSATSPAPSDQPSSNPSATPSQSPSASPSASPSVAPSATPSQSPSASPSATPSASPSARPSASPSVSPSHKPSARPSWAPSARPSARPSASPSDSPSARPTMDANLDATAEPSASPTMLTNLIISEVVDGRVDTGRPNYVELTNCGSEAVDLASYSLGIFNNAADEIRTDLRRNRAQVLSGILAPGDSYVVLYTNDETATTFADVYGTTVTPDLVVTHAINGDDVVALYEGRATGDGSDATLVDIYGQIGVQGRGSTWDWRTSFAVRNAGARSTPVWDMTQWVVRVRGTLRGRGADPLGDSINRLQNMTSPARHVCRI